MPEFWRRLHVSRCQRDSCCLLFHISTLSYLVRYPLVIPWSLIHWSYLQPKGHAGQWGDTHSPFPVVSLHPSVLYIWLILGHIGHRECVVSAPCYEEGKSMTWIQLNFPSASHSQFYFKFCYFSDLVPGHMAGACLALVLYKPVQGDLPTPGTWPSFWNQPVTTLSC